MRHVSPLTSLHMFWWLTSTPALSRSKGGGKIYGILSGRKTLKYDADDAGIDAKMPLKGCKNLMEMYSVNYILLYDVKYTVFALE